MSRLQESVVKHLLQIGAVALRPNEPFIWTSGIESPIYCDNRLTMSYPHVRQEIAQGLAQIIEKNFKDVQSVSGTATAGIPHAAWVADRMNLPMTYVRSSAKGHGKKNLIEGKLEQGERVVVIEDLISTGKSSVAAVEALREAGANVLGIVAIFTYGFKQADEKLAGAEVPYHTLTNYQTLVSIADDLGQFSEEEMNKLKAWNPFND
ncbi:orotate phosphoribosyltransferase [Bacillus horti]|uniref:Orotate phosphoribosyltransferase n=1 Tax=Caldalkalibacillus horti TaxID=77523 RepID=A0ABT9VX58_9BACI|nr:orotate phosphoribosyltransferase [Bacillus horti]MDQ0165571.1 orotate phosphoribosyltransferase [Bacillus horti]